MRNLLGIRCESESETKYRIAFASEEPSKFPFAWGDVEYHSASDVRGQYWEIFAARHYAFFPETSEPIIIDGGGNIGMSAIWFKQAYPNSQLIVYEADPNLIPTIQRNLASAKIQGVDVRHSAIWISDGTVQFDNRGGDKGTISTSGPLTIPSVDIASHLPERVDLLKLDIEGAEYHVIDRLCETGAISRVRNIVAEFHIRREDIDRFVASIQRLRNAGKQVSMRAAIGNWLGAAPKQSPFEIVGSDQILSEVYAWS